MSKNILLYFKIPLNDSRTGPHMYFNRWIPTEINPIIVYKDQVKLKLHINRDCVPSPDHSPHTERWSNITVEKVKVEIMIQNVSEELATSCRYIPHFFQKIPLFYIISRYIGLYESKNSDILI